MSEPTARVSKSIMSAHKAVTATVTTVAGFLTFLGTAIGDGSIGSAEVGTLVTAGITAVVTIYGVWQVRNKEV